MGFIVFSVVVYFLVYGLAKALEKMMPSLRRKG